MNPWLDPEERRFVQHECMKHQDVAAALGLRGVPPGEWIADGVEHRKADQPPHFTAGVPLKFTGDICPLCDPRGTMMERVRETTESYRTLAREHLPGYDRLTRRGSWDDGFGGKR